MVVSQREIAHWPNDDRVVDDHWTFFDRANRENRHLWLVDDGESLNRTENPGVGDRERAPLHIVDLQTMGACTIGEVLNSPAELDHVEAIGCANDGDNKTLFDCDGNAEID